MAPDLPIAHYFNGLVAYQKEDLDTAENSLREVLARAPTFGPALYLMGSVKYQQKQLAQAEDNLSRFLVDQPDNGSARKLLATTRSDQGDFEGALDDDDATFVDGDAPNFISFRPICLNVDRLLTVGR